MKKHYVLGFAFDVARKRVVLIRKQKPEWQAGKLNGIGGGIKSFEPVYSAMVREFTEEAGVVTEANHWRLYCSLIDAEWGVYVFATVLPPSLFDQIKTVETEVVEITAICDIYHGRSDIIENLPWLIPLALDTLEDDRPFTTLVTYTPPRYPLQDREHGN